MKWQAAKYSRRDRRWRRMNLVDAWHSKFAWRPVVIPEQKFDSIVTPRHWVWLERYEERRQYGELQRRSYTGQPSLRHMVRHG